jgi:hypothetical protein
MTQHLLSLNSRELVGAPSIEKLAAKMQVDPTTSKSNVERYNGLCAGGRDEEFAKDRSICSLS